MNIDALAGRVANRMRREIGDEHRSGNGQHLLRVNVSREHRDHALAQEWTVAHRIEIEQAEQAA